METVEEEIQIKESEPEATVNMQPQMDCLQSQNLRTGSTPFPVEQIKITTRVRTDLGDLESLMDSLQKHGLMNPITVNRQDELIAGHRRLESARRLGWTFIETTVLDKSTEQEKLELEIEENLHRRAFSDEELQSAWERLEALRKPGYFRMLWNWLVVMINDLMGSRSE